MKALDLKLFRGLLHLWGLFIRQGRCIEAGCGDKVLVSEAFAKANRLWKRFITE